MAGRVLEHPPPGRAGRRRRSGRSLWGPRKLLRLSGAFPPVFGAALVLGLTAAAGHLFLSSAGTAALHEDIAGTSASFAGLTAIFDGPVSSDRLAYQDGLLRQATAGVADLGSPSLAAVDTGQVGVGTLDRPPPCPVCPFARLATRDGFVRHIRRLAGGGTNGWWVPASIASFDHVRPGQTIQVVVEDEVGRAAGREIRLRVAGIYQDLVRLPASGFWAPLDEYVFASFAATSGLPPPFLLADRDRFLALEDRLAGAGHVVWILPARVGALTLPRAEVLSSELGRVEARMDSPDGQLGVSFAEHESGLPAVVSGARETEASLSSPVNGVATAGRVVALAVFVAAGVYGLYRRRVEFLMLQARGLGPVALGTRGIAEALIPAVMGAAAGWACAVWLVHLAGPSPLIAPGAQRVAAVDVGVTTLVALSLVGVAIAVALRESVDRRPGRLRRVAARLPWEVVVLVLAAASLYEIESRKAGAIGVGSTAGVDPLIPLFPILFVAGLGGLAVRGLRRLLPRLRTVVRTWPPSLYLAARRLAAASRPATLLMTLCVVAVGMVGYAGVFVSSVRATAFEKAHVSVGADVALTLPPEVTVLPKRLGAPATVILRLTQAGVPGTSAQVMGIDPATFSGAAFWDPGFAGRPLREVLADLSAPAGGAVAVLVANGDLPQDFSIAFAGGAVPAHVVDTAKAFPGMPAGRPLVVAATPALARALRSGTFGLQDLSPSPEVWVRGAPRPVLKALGRRRIVPISVITTARLSRSSTYLALSWLFGFLESLGVLTGVLALVALLLYVQSRQRTAEVSYVLASRMGLSPRAHRRSIAAELMAILVLAFLIGAALAAAGAFVIHHRVDPLPQIPPAALFRVPVALFGAVAGALLLFAVVASAVVQRRADRAKVAEVMRLAGG